MREATGKISPWKWVDLLGTVSHGHAPVSLKSPEQIQCVHHHLYWDAEPLTSTGKAGQGLHCLSALPLVAGSAIGKGWGCSDSRGLGAWCVHVVVLYCHFLASWTLGAFWSCSFGCSPGRVGARLSSHLWYFETCSNPCCSRNEEVGFPFF